MQTVAAIINEAHKAGKIAVVHVSNEQDAFEALSQGANGLVHLYYDKPMSSDHLKTLLKDKDFFVIPTVLTTLLVQELYFDKSPEEIKTQEKALLDEVKRLYEAGIPILAGTDPPNANINMGTDLYKELAYFAKAGLPIEAVLASATSEPAKAFDLEGRGFIKKNFKADLLLLAKSPVKDIKNLTTIEHIWKEGNLIEN